MDDVEIFSKINNKVSQLQAPNRGTGKYAPCFVGEDMHPQYCTALSWGKQFVSGVEYYREGDLWLSTQQFIFRRMFNFEGYVAVTFTPSLLPVYYIESMRIHVDNYTLLYSELSITCEANPILEVDISPGEDIYSNNYEQLIQQGEIFKVATEGFLDVDVEIYYRMVL